MVLTLVLVTVSTPSRHARLTTVPVRGTCQWHLPMGPRPPAADSADGLPGQTVRVRNPKTKREFYAKVQDEQTVLIHL